MEMDGNGELYGVVSLRISWGRPHSHAENRAPSRGKQDSKQQVSQDQTDGRVVGEKAINQYSDAF